jgi:CheY-like chemotaxis protein
MKERVNVLVVEDLELAQLAADDIFQELDCDPTIVESGAEALDEVIAENYDIIFMDLQLPDMNGFELTATIRLLERKNRRLPIVAVTANYLENMAQKCKEAGFDDFMLKPLTVDAVRHMLEKHLSRLGLNTIES